MNKLDQTVKTFLTIVRGCTHLAVSQVLFGYWWRTGTGNDALTSSTQKASAAGRLSTVSFDNRFRDEYNSVAFYHVGECTQNNISVFEDQFKILEVL